MLVVFDDCAAEFKQYLRTDIFRKFFYQNRHVKLTIGICCQNENDLDTNLRKNVFLSIFTTAQTAQSYFANKSNQFTKKEINTAISASTAVFQGYRKLAYLRDDPDDKNFYSIEAPYVEPFRFGSSALHDLCEKVKNDKGSINTSNSYYNKFKI
jgi:hypothetical protein